MTEFRLLITVSGYCKGVVEAADEDEARAKCHKGDWRETRTNYDYELEEIEEPEGMSGSKWAGSPAHADVLRSLFYLNRALHTLPREAQVWVRLEGGRRTNMTIFVQDDELDLDTNTIMQTMVESPEGAT